MPMGGPIPIGGPIIGGGWLVCESIWRVSSAKIICMNWREIGMIMKARYIFIMTKVGWCCECNETTPSGERRCQINFQIHYFESTPTTHATETFVLT